MYDKYEVSRCMMEKTDFQKYVETEYDKTLSQFAKYMEELEAYPKGSLHKQNKYDYLVYREKGKVQKKYIKKDEVEQLEVLLIERKEKEEEIERLKRLLRELEYMIHFKEWRIER